jgi:hypothetical protein
MEKQMGKIADALKGKIAKRINPTTLLHEHGDKVLSKAKDEATQFVTGFVKKQLLFINMVVGVTSFILGGVTYHFIFG